MYDHLDRLCLPWVLEYLEANRRIHIISRAPGLQNLNRRTPLRLDFLEFNDDSFRVNGVVYRITTNKYNVPYNEEDFRREENLPPEDIAITPKDGIWARKEVRIQFKNPQYWRSVESKYSRAVPFGVEPHVATKKMMNVLLGHPNIHVNTMSFPLKKIILRIPLNFKPRVYCLDSQKREFFHFIPLLHPDCLPLKVLQAELLTPEYLDHPVLKSAETLIILDAKFRLTLELLQNISNKHVQIMKYCITQSIFLDLISFWKRNVTEIGRTFEFACRGEDQEGKFMGAAKVEFIGQYSKFDGSYAARCLTLSMDSDTVELVILGCFAISGSIRMEVMAMDCPSKPLQQGGNIGESRPGSGGTELRIRQEGIGDDGSLKRIHPVIDRGASTQRGLETKRSIEKAKKTPSPRTLRCANHSDDDTDDDTDERGNNEANNK